ncbi:MAG: hypothetical protein ABFD80_04470, partial [Acidobacteriota bacterium]
YTNWATITPEQERFKARILQADLHVICTMRSKQDYVLEDNEKGKKAPRKVGLAPIQRDGMEYEFTTVLDLAMDHNAAPSKDRTGLFDGQVFKPSKETGVKIMKWLKAAKAVQKPAAEAPPAKAEPQDKPGFSFPEEGSAASTPAPTITQGQTEKIQTGIKALVNLGRTSETIWKGIRQRIVQVFKKEFAELNELTGIEADTVITYLAEWEKYEKQPKQPRAEAGGSRG